MPRAARIVSHLSVGMRDLRNPRQHGQCGELRDCGVMMNRKQAAPWIWLRATGGEYEPRGRPRDHRQHRAELATDFGVKSLALFGSVVRGESTSASDVDFLVEFDGRPFGLFHLSRTQHYLEDILGVPGSISCCGTASSRR